jgi:hypothetical protein
MREERKLRFYRCLPGELVLLIVVFALFIVLVLTLFLIPLLSFTQQQGQAASVRRETGPWLIKARQQQGRFAMPNPLFCSRGVVVPDLGDHGMVHTNLSENQEVLARVTHGLNPVPLRGDSCSRI